MKLVVVGAGPSGLSAAHHAATQARARGEAPDVVVLEESARAGGAIGTESIAGFLVERGADGFLTEKRAVVDLAAELGIAGRLVRTLPARDGAYVVKNGELCAIPHGFSMMAPLQIRPFLRSPLLSWRGKARALAEIVLPRGASADDETLASFVRRRFGDEVLERLAQPLVSGIYGADPERLSLRATMPRFPEEEDRSRSVTLGLRRKARTGAQASGARYGLFASFDHGMQVLVDALVSRIPELRLGEAVLALEPRAGGVSVVTARGRYEAERVILAVGGTALERLLRPLDGELADAIARIELGSCATVALGFERRVVPARLDGYGFVVPRIEGRPSLAATFLSRKWPARAPETSDLVRVFLRDARASDEELIASARAELAALLGVDDPPLFARATRWEGAMPQLHLGHLAHARRIDALAARLPWLRIAGNRIHGVGLPDAITAGRRAASLAPE